MSIEDLKYQIQSGISEIESAIDDLSELEDMETSAEAWAQIENKFGEPDEVEAELQELRGIRLVFEGIGRNVETADDVEEVVDELVAASSPEGDDEIVTAINLLLSTLIRAGVLPGMETVLTSGSTEEPAVADNAVIADPTFTNLQNI
tara:strand:- start:439 stop:882 length:444 start_codon:yes stop_codon:yes gene_type:complete